MIAGNRRTCQGAARHEFPFAIVPGGDRHRMLPTYPTFTGFSRRVLYDTHAREPRLCRRCSVAAGRRFAQQSASSGLVGQVTDSSQAAIPGATVTVTNVGTNAQRTTVTDGEGRFSVPALPPATYHIKVELQGFRTVELQNFVLRQGETARPTITLGIATVERIRYRHGRGASAADAKRNRRTGHQRAAD